MAAVGAGPLLGVPANGRVARVGLVTDTHVGTTMESCVRVRVERHFDRLEFTVVDEGAGFDWQRYVEFDPDRAGDPNGRGIAMARMLSFASLEYRGNGNTAVATIRTTLSRTS